MKQQGIRQPERVRTTIASSLLSGTRSATGGFRIELLTLGGPGVRREVIA